MKSIDRTDRIRYGLKTLTIAKNKPSGYIVYDPLIKLCYLEVNRYVMININVKIKI